MVAMMESEAEGGEGSIARRLWKKMKREYTLALYSPFFVCLASSTLHSSTFLHFISQDPHFLRSFSLAYDMAEDCADDEEDKIAIRKLKRRVTDKLKNHAAIVREWGFELPEESSMNTAMVKFTDFLLATSSGKVDGEKVPGNLATPFERTKIAAYTLGAMAPCLRLFASICKEIQCDLRPDDSSHIYKNWVDDYCSPGLEEAAQQIEGMLDRLSISLTGEELEVIGKLYHQATKLEVDFFSTQPIVQQTIVPLHRGHEDLQLTVFCDFDMTCTVVDSSALLADLAILTAPKDVSSESENKLACMSSADLRSMWLTLSTQYVEEYDQCLESIIPNETVIGLQYESLSKALERFADFEKNANSRVIQSGVLKGLLLEDIRRAGQRLAFQDGCKGFFQKIFKHENIKADVHILSYCWCGDLIRSALSSGDLDVVKVHSNELAYQESVSTGEIIMTVESPIEKLQAYSRIYGNTGDSNNHLTVYIGGSVGDLLSLLKADIGIVIGSSPSLKRLGHQFGVSFIPLFSGLVEKQKELKRHGSPNWKGSSGILYTVSSWDEIHAFILGS